MDISGRIIKFSENKIVPSQLKDTANWVCWKLETRKGKLTKVPYNPHTGQKASSTDSSTWAPFDVAIEARNNGQGYNGVGCCFADSGGFTGVDLDDCIVNGKIDSWAVTIIESLNSYTEISPSGDGVHIFVSGTLPQDNFCKKKVKNSLGKSAEIEMYSRKRFFTFTGKHLVGTPAEVMHRQDELDALYREVFAEKLAQAERQVKPSADAGGFAGSDAELLDAARTAKNGQKFRALFDAGDIGAYGNDDSSADQALCQILAFWCGPNPERIERLFGQSALAREKWDNRPDYRTGTISKAISRCKEYYSEGNFKLTEVGNAERFVHQHKGKLLYCDTWGKWLVYDGKRWNAQRGAQAAHEAARLTVRGILQEGIRAEDPEKRAATIKWAMASEKASQINAILQLARYMPRMISYAEEFDQDGMLLNCRNGTIDLRTGALRPHNPADMITKLAPAAYDPDAKLKLLDEFLETATDGNSEMLGFLQVAAGYSSTGDTSEEKLFFIYGPTASGKSTFLEAVKATLGDYVQTADFDTFLRRPQIGGVRNDIARLAGSRWVISIEVDEGKALAEGLIKTLTGGDTITARFLYKECFEFTPQFKLWLAANDEPRVSDGDEALWRRILRVPFDRSIPKERRDPKVKATLKDTKKAGPAILAWIVQGALLWQEEGLKVPGVVEASTQAYRDSQDPLQDFFEDEVEFDATGFVPAAELRARYAEYAKNAGIRFTLGSRAFNERLKARGCVEKTKRVANDIGTIKPQRCWVGATLKIRPQYNDDDIPETDDDCPI